jgi:hypothetical protein
MAKSEIRRVAAILGRRGGKASLKTMTRSQRVARAKKAIAARWARTKKGGK